MEGLLENGLIKLIEETQTFKGDFKKREFVVTTEGNYPQPIKFEMIGDNVDYLDNFEIGNKVKVAYIVRGNEYNGKYYVNLRAIAIGLVDDEGNAKVVVTKSKPKATTNVVENNSYDDDDDLPF